MPWQRHVVDVALEVDDVTGRLAFREVVVTVPRQSGKSSLVLPMLLHRCVAFGEAQRVVYTAQSRLDARHKLVDDWVPVVSSSRFDGLFSVRLSNGSEGLAWDNGSLFELSATTERASHGRTIDVAVVDEAFAMRDSRLEQAFKPAMITRPQPQMWVVSTAGTAESSYLWGKVERGRAAAEAGECSGVAFFEWSAAPDAPAGDPSTWGSCMPALGHTITDAAVAAEFRSMDEADFCRAYLNRWTTARTLPPIPLEPWGRCAVEGGSHGDVLTFAVDVSPDHRFASVVVASQTASGTFVELAESDRGTEWVLPWLCERWTRWSPSAIWVDPAGPAGSLVPELVAYGCRVETVSAREMGQACAALFDSVSHGVLAHTGDPRMAAALGAGGKRWLGDLWLWSRADVGADITPAVALTLAHWGARKPSSDAAPEPVFAF
jgi:phage terminase large subunit-like protein